MIRLHHCHQTRSMRVLWLLHELAPEFEVVLHHFDKSLRSEGYLALNPAGRVPAVEIFGETLWESGAIMQLLCELFEDAGMGRAPGNPERPEWLIWLHFAETISQHVAALTQQHIALYDDTMRSPIVMKLEAKRLEKCYQALEPGLRERQYLLPGGFSAADIAVGQAVYMARHFARIDGFPGLADWYQRISRRAAFRASLPPKGADLLWKQEFYEPLNG